MRLYSLSPSKTTPLRPPIAWELAPLSPSITWDQDLRSVLALQLDVVRYRERTEPYYRGETTKHPSYLDHDGETDADSDSASDTVAGSSDTSDGYVPGDAPVHTEPCPQWSSSFIEDFTPYGVPAERPRTPSPLPPYEPVPLTHVYTRTELEHHHFEAHLDWHGPTPVTEKKGRVVGVLVDSLTQTTDWNRVVLDATDHLKNVAKRVDYAKLPLTSPPSPIERSAAERQHNSINNLVEICDLRHTNVFGLISGWQNLLHLTFALRLYSHIHKTKSALLENNPNLRDNFTGGAFASTEVYLGNQESPP
ncbi:hypothetical protein FB451DRAFT_1198291 [Mycena latifolia]|nr:hypothetical protein FB451DRAFT_1198291 [Mycena latifolia]